MNFAQHVIAPSLLATAFYLKCISIVESPELNELARCNGKAKIDNINKKTSFANNELSYICKRFGTLKHNHSAKNLSFHTHTIV